MQKGKFNFIVDQSWGSSGKGAVSTRLVDIHKVENASSCNYPNAGHTAIVKGVKFVAKALPTPAILNKFNPAQRTKLWLGPGSAAFVTQLEKEMHETSNTFSDVMIHERAMVVTDTHVQRESPGGILSTEHISSTMSGSGAAFADKVMRGKEVKLMRDVMPTINPPMFIGELRNKLYSGETFLHEVSQGFALSINHGTHYPCSTFRDCTPQQAMADFSLLPNMIGDVYLNLRTFPIRAGNNFRDGVQTGYSGDVMPDQIELSWEGIAEAAEWPEVEAKALAEAERTTVTKKIRRVFTFSDLLLTYAANATGANKLILNFPQYIHYSAFGMKGGKEQLSKLHSTIRKFIDRIEKISNLPVVMICTGPNHDDYIYLE